MADKTLTVIESQMLPAISDRIVNLELTDDAYTIKGFEEFKQQVIKYQELVEGYEYQEADRQAIKKLKASVNKYSKEIVTQANAQKARLFGQVDTEKKQLEDELNKLVRLLSVGLDEDDRRYRADKREKIKELFDEAVANYEHLSGKEVDFDSIMMASWLNRSVTIQKATDELNKMIKTLNSLVGDPKCPTETVSDVIDSLVDNDWDGYAAMNELIDIERARQERAMKEEMERRIQEEMALQQAIDNKEDVVGDEPIAQKLPKKLVRIDGEDWQRAKTLLTAAGINFEEI